MKMKIEHYNYIKGEILALLAIHNPDNELAIAYEKGEFHNFEKTKDLQLRFCYDLFWAAGLSKYCSDNLRYLNDNHIYTALKKICPIVTRQF